MWWWTALSLPGDIQVVWPVLQWGQAAAQTKTGASGRSLGGGSSREGP